MWKENVPCRPVPRRFSTGTRLATLGCAILMGSLILGSPSPAEPTTGNGTLALEPTETYVLHAAHAASTPDWWTVLNLVNRGPYGTPVLLEVFDGAGAPVASYNFPMLPPNGALRADLDAVFGADLGSDLWIRVTGQSELIGAVEFGTRDGGTLAVLPLFDDPSAEVIFSYVYTTPSTGESYYTGITVLNPGAAAAEVQLTAYSENGELLAQITTPVAPGAKYVRLVDQIFPEVADPNAIRMIWVQSSQPVLAFELFGKWNEYGVAGLPAVDVSSTITPASTADEVEAQKLPTGDLIYNEIPSNSAWYTGMTVCNLTAAPARVYGLLYDAAGNTLTSIWWDLGPYQQLTREVWEFFGATPDPAATAGRMKADSPIAGFELMLSREGAFRFDGLEAAYRVFKQIDFPLVRTGGEFTTRLRLTKIYPFANAVELTAFDTGGNILGSYSTVLESLATIDLDLATLFPDAVGQIAWFRVVAQDKLAGSVFMLSTDGQRLGSYLGIGRQ